MATWFNGTFNGGEFGPLRPKWKDGTFNGGKFTSIYGTSSGTYSISTLDDVSSYAWENGAFNGGEFGNSQTAYNSSWFNGTFNGGKFKGKVWNNGIFTFGEFSGSGKNAIGGTPSSTTQSNPNNFVQPFIDTNKEYYGLWRNGFVTDTKSKYLDEEIFSDLKRSSDTNKSLPFTLLKNILWLSGTFSHSGATIQDSVWLDGTFENGIFKTSAFNPYVIRTLSSSATFNFSDTCKWSNGSFDSGEFSISNWENGNFIMGTATGMIWKKGIVNYMNAYNVFWEDGLWRNGNWEGSYYTINPDGTVTDPYVKQILNRGMSWSGTSSCHIWSVFYKESLTQLVNNNGQLATNVVYQPDLTAPQSPLPPTQFGVIGAGTTPGSTSPTSPGTNKVLGGIAWSSTFGGGTAPKVGSDATIDIVFTGIDPYNPVRWSTSTGNNQGTFITTLIETKTFTLVNGVNTFIVKGTNPDNNQIYETNQLTYTSTIPAYTISSSISNNITSSTTGTVVVNTAPVTLILRAYAGNSTLYNARGIAAITLNGNVINGSPFDTTVAIGGGIKTKTITLSSIGTYNVTITAAIGGPGGYIKLT